MMVTCVIGAEKNTSRRTKFLSLLKKAFGFPVMLVVLLAGIVYLAIPRTIADPDISWHLRNAQVLLHTHAFLRQDLYSSTTKGKPWVNPEWLAEIPFYAGWRWFGERGVFLVSVGAIETILLGIFGLAYLQSKNVKSAFVISFLAIFLADVSFGPRTLLFGWIFLVAELAILQSFHAVADGSSITRPRDLTWLLPPLFLLWINIHGSWMIGLALLAFFVLSGYVKITCGLIEAKRWSGPQKRKLLRVTTLSVLALFINPYGWRLVLYPFDMAFHQKLNIANVQEWRSLDFHSPHGKIILGIMAGAIVLQLVRRRKWMLHEVGFLLLGLYAGLTYSRFLFLTAILILPLFAKDIAECAPYYPERDKPWLNAPIMIGLMAAAVVLFPSNRQLQARWADQYPQKALNYLGQLHPSGNVFTYYEWGGYLIWNVRQVPTFVDSRVDVFEHHGVLADYLDAVRLKDSFRILDKYSIRYVLFKKGEPLTYLLVHTPGWKVDYQDKITILLEKK